MSAATNKPWSLDCVHCSAVIEFEGLVDEDTVATCPDCKQPNYVTIDCDIGDDDAIGKADFAQCSNDDCPVCSKDDA
jgi:hypothetical protein